MGQGGIGMGNRKNGYITRKQKEQHELNVAYYRFQEERNAEASRSQEGKRNIAPIISFFVLMLIVLLALCMAVGNPVAHK